MNVFINNRDYRVMLINQWISSFGDIIFYLALINYVTPYSFAPLAILLITISETIPQILQIFTGVIADFQNHRIKKYVTIAGIKFILYALLTLIIETSEFGITTVFIICGINIVSDTLSYFAGAMLTPIYVRVIKEDMTSAMGFRQATANTVNILGNTIGGLLIGIISIEAFVAINALTFLFAFIGILTIQNRLIEFEKDMTAEKKAMTLVSLLEHLKQSLIALKQYPVVIELLLMSIFGQVILSSLIPMSSLLLIKTSFYSLSTAQSIAILSVVLFMGSVIGNLLSGSMLKNLSTKLVVFISQLTRVLIIIGFIFGNFLIILIASLLCSITVGIVSPRISKYMFTFIPEDKIGTVQSGLGALSVVIPGIITMGIVGLASIKGIQLACLPLILFIAIVFFILKQTRNLD